jgi:hypothetical protein
VRNRRQYSIHHVLAMPPCFVPESQFNPVPKPELIVDNAQVVLDYVLADANGFGDFTVLKPLGRQAR